MQAVTWQDKVKVTEPVKEKLDSKCSKNYCLAKFSPACEFPAVEKCDWNAHLEVRARRSLQAWRTVRQWVSGLKAVESWRLRQQHRWESAPVRDQEKHQGEHGWGQTEQRRTSVSRIKHAKWRMSMGLSRCFKFSLEIDKKIVNVAKMFTVINSIYVTHPSQDLEVVYKGTYIIYFYFIGDQTEQIKCLEQSHRKSVVQWKHWSRASVCSSVTVKVLECALLWKVAFHLTADLSV